MSEQPQDPRMGEAWFAPAVRALHAAQAGNHDGAKASLQEIQQVAGEHGMWRAILAWIDTALAVVGEIPQGAQVAVTYYEMESGEFHHDETRLSPEQRWATKLIQARAADDKGRFDEVMESLDGPSREDPFLIGRHVSALLLLCAANINAGMDHPNRQLRQRPE